MEKITDKIAGIPKDGTYFSLEFFPPKTQMVCSSPGSVILSLTIPQRDFPIYKVAWSACHEFSGLSLLP